MNEYVITISRTFGSGGRTVGKMLSQKLGIPYYDKDLIKLASEESGINEGLFGLSDERTKAGIFNRGKVYDGKLKTPDSPDFTSEDNLFSYQAKIIRDLADKKAPCIIIGRCADFVLSGREKVLRLFIWADKETGIKNTMDVCGYDRKEAEKQTAKINRERSAYYRKHTGSEWTDVRNYDLCIDTSRLNFEKCMELIESYLSVIGYKE